MNGDSYPKGCPGAVWSNRDPAQKYCGNDDRYPRWKKCCVWQNDKCIPKGNIQVCYKFQKFSIISFHKLVDNY